MRPLTGLVLLLALIALLVGGLFWLGGQRANGTLEKPVADAPGAPHAQAPEAQLSATGADAEHADRAAQPAAMVKLDSAGAEKDSKGLSGRVIGADGKPVPGAKVFAGPGDGPAFMPLDAIDPKSMPWARRADDVTDAEGRFQLDLTGETHVRIAVRAGGFAPLDEERTLARGEHDLGDVALEPGVVLEGRVIDQLGRPVAEAQLYSRPRSNGFSFSMPERGRAPLATTDAQGHFRVDMLASGPWRMLVSSEEHPDKTFDGQTDRPGSVARNLEFALEEGAQISGRVTGATTEVVAKLQVSAQQRTENEDENGGMMVFGADGFLAPRKAKVGADGNFTVRGLKPGQNYRLQAQKADSAFFGFGMGSRKGTSAKSGDRGIEVPYTAAGAIVCQVVDAASGKPVTEMDVKAGYGWSIPMIGPDGKPVGNFPEGKVRFDRLPPRMDFGGGKNDGLKLRIDATGYKSYESAALTPADGQDIDLGVVRLERAPVCRVQVLDLASGAPLAGAEVTLREEGSDSNSGFGRRTMRIGRGGRTVNDQGVSQGTTGADGNVVLSSFPGKQATLSVKHADYAAWKSAALTLSASGDHQETVKLARGGEVLVSVVDPKGQPVASVEIEHSFATGEEQNPWMRRFSGGGPTRTDAKGELLFSHLEAGSHRFRISSGNGGMRFFGGGGAGATIAIDSGGGQEQPQEEPWTSADVAEGGQAAIKLVAPTRSTVVGRVREGGTPLAGASVHLEEKKENAGGFGGLPFFGGQDGPRTNGSGEYKAEGIKPGKYSVTVSHPGRAMNWEGELEVREGEIRYDVELPISIVEGRVTSPDGKPVAGARVTAERAQSGQQQERQVMVSMVVAGDGGGDAFSFGGSAGAEPVRTDADGRYTLRGVATDTDLVVHVQGKDFSPANSEKFRVAPDQTLRGIDIQTKQGAGLEVHVTRAGQPARNVLVNAYHKGKNGDEDQQSQVSGPGGVAKFSGLEPGDWEYAVTDISAEPSPTGSNDGPAEAPRKPVALKAGETAKVDAEVH